MAEAEVSALKDALCTQQKLLLKLYNELEAEREASATAASEALSVILRLQGEKAAVKMEAEQYKRLAEERMCHAEESFALIEDMITEKEMEVAELDYQVQTYRYQLMSMGFDVPGGDDDINLPENLFHRNESLTGETSLHLKCKKAMLELESSTSADLDFLSKPAEDMQLGQETFGFVSDSDKKVDGSSDEGLSSYAEQIKDLEQRVKEMTGANITGLMSEAPSPSLSKRPSAANLSSLANFQHETRPLSQLSVGSSYGQNKLDVVDETGSPTKHPQDSPKDSKVIVQSPRPPTVHDVFEVPQIDQESSSCHESSSNDGQDQAQTESVKEITKEVPEWVKNLLQSTQKEVPQGEQESTSHESSSKHKQEEVFQDLAHPEPVKQIAKDEPDWLKKLLESTHHEKNLCKPSDIAAIDRGLVQPETSVAVAFVKPRTSVDLPESNMSRLNRSPENGEAERPSQSSAREEEMKLLIEIREKLNLLQDELALQKEKKSIKRDEPSLQPLAEVMVSFWL